MTDSKTPEWVKEEAAKIELGRPSWERGYIGDVPNLVSVNAISQALLSAYERGRKEGIEEAAKVAIKQAPATQDWADAPLQDQRTATAIRQLLEVKG